MTIECDNCRSQYTDLADTRQYVKFNQTDFICPECEDENATFSSV